MRGWMKICALLLVGILLLSFGGCKKEETESAVTVVADAAADAPAPTERRIRSDLMKLMLDDMKAERSMLSDIERSEVAANGACRITFRYHNTDCYYLMDAYTGAILEKEIPELTEDFLVSEAIDAAFAQAELDYAERHPDADPEDPEEQEDPQNVAYSVSSMSNGGRCINVHFNWKDEFFNYDYDTYEEAIRTE